MPIFDLNGELLLSVDQAVIYAVMFKRDGVFLSSGRKQVKKKEYNQDQASNHGFFCIVVCVQ